MRFERYTIEWDSLALKQLHKIKEGRLKEQILDIIENEIAYDPLIGKPLTGSLRGARSYRFGVLRVLYRFFKDRLVIIILSVAHRKKAYQR